MVGRGGFIGESIVFWDDLNGKLICCLGCRLMSSNSMVLKSTVFPEWYSDKIQPWLQ